ncbi:hypothetical protein [Halopelagius fulvigenes]|uniref:Uncharacterized protein n=1 Tax=Halopelagius fulvigenes TaxID=1198324 RepID=A0ABD5TY04_9EURY
MKPLPPIPTVEAYDRTVTARSLVVSYLLVAAVPLALWAASELLPALVAVTAAAAAVTAGRRLRRREPAQRRYLCVPHTPVCVEL